MATLHVDVVSAEESIFSGEAKFVVLPGESGELGIMPGHTPLISRIRPGTVKIVLADGSGETNVFVAGGILEVQPGGVTVLSDTYGRTGAARYERDPILGDLVKEADWEKQRAAESRRLAQLEDEDAGWYETRASFVSTRSLCQTV